MTGELCSSLETEAKVAVGLYGDEERPQLFRLVRGWQNRVHLLLRQRLKVKIFRCLQFMNRHVWGGHEGFAVVENPGRLFRDAGARNDVKAHHAPYTILHGPLFPPVQRARDRNVYLCRAIGEELQAKLRVSLPVLEHVHPP